MNKGPHYYLRSMSVIILVALFLPLSAVQAQNASDQKREKAEGI
jgi:hypothetical protein